MDMLRVKRFLPAARWLALCHAERAVRQRVVCGAEHGDDEDRALRLKSRCLARLAMRQSIGPWQTSSPALGR